MTLSFSGMTRFIRGREMADKELELQAQILTFLILISALHIGVLLMATIVTGLVPPTNDTANLTALVLQILFLIGLRYSDAIENLALAYHCLTFMFVSAEILGAGKSFMAQTFPLFPATLLAGFFTIRSWSKRLVMILVGMGLAGYCVQRLWHMPSIVPYGLRFDDFRNKIIWNMILKSSLIIFCVNWYLRSKELKEETIQADLEDKLNSVKLEEINNLIRSLFPDLNKPLLALVDETQELIGAGEDIHPRYFEHMRMNLKLMNATAQTVAWIYRAYRNEPINATASSFLFDQLCLLVTRRMRNQPWEVEYNRSPRNFECEGPVPSVMLLILTIVDEIQQKTQGGGDKVLTCDLSTDSLVVIWRLTFPFQRSNSVSGLWYGKDEETLETVSQMDFRTELARDLIRLSGARVHESVEGSLREVTITGPWLVGSEGRA